MTNQKTTDNEYFSLLDRLNRIPVIIPAQAKRSLTAKRQKTCLTSLARQGSWLYEDLLKENGEGLW